MTPGKNALSTGPVPPPVVFASALVVDDSPLQRDHAAQLCRTLGFTDIHTAGNGSEAIAVLSQLSPLPDLMILDLEMPTMDGSQTLQRLHQLGIDVRILVVSAREQSLLNLVLDMGNVLGLTIVGALQKPLRLEDMQSVMNKSSTSWPPPRSAAPAAPLAISSVELAVAIEGGKMQTYFQPKVNVLTGEICGVEALARWQHPSLGYVPPSDFIPVAEAHDLIHDLTMRVMNDALGQAAVWAAEGVDLSVAVNVSPRLLHRGDLPTEFLSLQQLHRVSPSKIIFEITESSWISGNSVALGVLARLRLRGFGLSIDDYGTGFSSLQQLTRVPFTELKIDRSFVHKAYERESHRVILRSALDLAAKLGITAVAEGVESLEDWRFLQSLGCLIAQGYLIGKPMPAEAFMPWVEEFRERAPSLVKPPA